MLRLMTTVHEHQRRTGSRYLISVTCLVIVTIGLFWLRRDDPFTLEKDPVLASVAMGGKRHVGYFVSTGSTGQH